MTGMSHGTLQHSLSDVLKAGMLWLSLWGCSESGWDIPPNFSCFYPHISFRAGLVPKESLE